MIIAIVVVVVSQDAILSGKTLRFLGLVIKETTTPCYYSDHEHRCHDTDDEMQGYMVGSSELGPRRSESDSLICG